MMIDQVRKLSTELRLNGFADALERRLKEAENNGLGPLEFLRLLLGDEDESRRNRIGARLTNNAHFRRSADLEDWDLSYDRGITKQKLKELSLFGFYHNQEGLLIYGKTGEGKTQLAIALGRRLCASGISTHFFAVNFLFEEILAAKAAGKYLSFIKKINRAKVLILDDFGMRNYNHDEATMLLDILEDRYQNGVTIVTSQVDVRGWRKLFEDPVVAEAITDRLQNPAQSVVLKGGSYRERMQVAKKQKTVETNTTKH